MRDMIPTLETARLRLRAWRMEDFDAYAALKVSPELQRFTGGAQTREQAWVSFCAAPGEWALRGAGVFLVAERDGDRAVGFAGLWFPPFLDEPELCWSLFPGATGKGYATEAARAARTWACMERGMTPLMSFVHPDNHASQAVARRLDAVKESRATLFGEPRIVFRHPGQSVTN